MDALLHTPATDSMGKRKRAVQGRMHVHMGRRRSGAAAMPCGVLVSMKAALPRQMTVVASLRTPVGPPRSVLLALAHCMAPSVSQQLSYAGE